MPDVTAASFPVTIGEREYMMSPLSDRDIEEVNNWLRATYIQMARASITPDMTAAQREETLAVAMREARQINWYDRDSGGRLMQDLGGVSRVFWQSLKKRHPDLTHDEVRAWCVDPVTVQSLVTVWKELNLKPAKDDGRREVGKANPRQGAARRRSTHS